MTLCIAATCQDRGKDCIVVSTDWKTDIGDLAGAEIQNKLYWLYDDNWPVLISGTASDALSLIGTYRDTFQKHGCTRANVYGRVVKPALEHKRKRIDEYVQARTGKDYDYFRLHQAEFGKQLREDIWKDISKMKLGCDLILCTFIKGVPFIFWLDGDTCQVHRDDNFLAIGTGDAVATTMLCFRWQHEERALADTLYHVYEATRIAYKSRVPGVGRNHAISVLYPNGAAVKSKEVRKSGFAALEKIFQRSGPRKLPKGFVFPKNALKEYR